jgi:hypothetical protein
MNTTISVVPALEPQPASPYDSRRDDYQVYCTSYKRASRPGSLVAAVEVFIPAFSLHLSCRLTRDGRGHQRLDLPRVKVEDPAGRTHHKSLLRWSTSEAERRFQMLGLAAIAEYQRNTATRWDPLPTRARFAPLLEPAPSLASSASPATDNR